MNQQHFETLFQAAQAQQQQQRLQQQEGAGEDEVGALSSSLSSGLAYDEEWNQEQAFGTSFQSSAAPVPHSIDAPTFQYQKDRQVLENLFKSLQQPGNDAAAAVGHGGFHAPMDNAPLPPTGGLRSHVSAGPSFPTQQMDRLILDNLFKSWQAGNQQDATSMNVRGAFDAPVPPPPPSGLRSHVSVGSSYQQPPSQSMSAFNFMYSNNQQQQQQQQHHQHQPPMFSHSALNNMRQQQEPFVSSLSTLQNQQTSLSQSLDLAAFLRLQQLQQQQQQANTLSNLDNPFHLVTAAAATKTNDLDAELPTLPQEKVRSHQWISRIVPIYSSAATHGHSGMFASRFCSRSKHCRPTTSFFVKNAIAFSMVVRKTIRTPSRNPCWPSTGTAIAPRSVVTARRTAKLTLRRSVAWCLNAGRSFPTSAKTFLNKWRPRIWNDTASSSASNSNTSSAPLDRLRRSLLRAAPNCPLSQNPYLSRIARPCDAKPVHTVQLDTVSLMNK
jgi:hypothetical protein